jgi:hypothetical protein
MKASLLLFAQIALAGAACLISGQSPAVGGVQPSRPFSVHDLNGDGYLSQEEYTALLELRRARHRQHRGAPSQPGPAFEEVDRDGDGLIGEAELTDVLQRGMHRYRWRRGRWQYPPDGG